MPTIVDDAEIARMLGRAQALLAEGKRREMGEVVGLLHGSLELEREARAAEVKRAREQMEGFCRSGTFPEQPPLPWRR